MSNRLLVRIRGRIFIHDLEAELKLTESEILNELKSILRKSASTFGLKPFRIEFDGQRGWSILPSSCVGLLSGELLTVVLESRLSNLQTEKVLALAQLVGPNLYRISSDSVQAAVTSSNDFGTSDLLAMSLVDVCAEIRRTGRDFIFTQSRSKSFNIRGSIDFAESLQTASIRPPISMYDSVSYMTDANLFILAALEKAREMTRLDIVLQALSRETGLWTEDIDLDGSHIGQKEVSDFSSSYPRSDYRRAINLATAILLDMSLETNGNEVAVPQVLADLDLLFEQYCSMQLRSLLPASAYEVQDQLEVQHPARPNLSGFIKPDLVITNRKSGKTLVVDLKNKYSSIGANQKSSLNNSDIYQIAYYAQALGTTQAMLVYPTTEEVDSFPIKKSESASKYAEKVETFRELREISEPILSLGSNKVTLIPYQVDLSGTMINTAKSLASLAMYIDFLLTMDLT